MPDGDGSAAAIEDKENVESVEEADEVGEENTYLGENPGTAKSLEVKLSAGFCERLQAWMTTGISEEAKTKLLDSIPRKGSCSFEAPILNEEVILGMTDGAVKRDAFFAGHQNLAGSALSLVSAVLQDIFDDKVRPLQRKEILSRLSESIKLLAELMRGLSITRKSFITPGFEKNMRSTLEKTTPDEFLFGKKLQDLVTGTEALVKVSKQIKPPPAKKRTEPLQPKNSLNWASAPGKREGGRGAPKDSQHKPRSTSKQWTPREPHSQSRRPYQSQPI